MREILIYKNIGDSLFGDTVTAEDVKAQIDDADGDDLLVRINSKGGSVFEGFAIYNLLEQYEGNIDVVVDGLAASIASVIALSGRSLKMAKNSRLMMHNAFGGLLGDAKAMRKTADLLDSLTDTIAEIYAEKSGKDKKSYLDKMDKETWLKADEAVSEGLADSLMNKEADISNEVSCPWISEPPKTKDEREELERNVSDWINLQKRRLKLLKADA